MRHEPKFKPDYKIAYQEVYRLYEEQIKETEKIKKAFLALASATNIESIEPLLAELYDFRIGERRRIEVECPCVDTLQPTQIETQIKRGRGRPKGFSPKKNKGGRPKGYSPKLGRIKYQFQDDIEEPIQRGRGRPKKNKVGRPRGSRFI